MEDCWDKLFPTACFVIKGRAAMRLMEHNTTFSLFLLTVITADQSNAALSASPMTPAKQLSNTSNTISSAAQTTNTTSSNDDLSSNTSSLSSADTSSDVTASTCTTRRCLANVLIEKKALSQPQCVSNITVPSILYETLSVDIKKLRFQSRLDIDLSWEDPDLSWDTSVYPHDTVVLPVRKIWTPQFHVYNGVETTTEPGNQDLLVHSNGTVEHSVIMNTVVDCEVNLYKYPFVSDSCAIALNGWANGGCGLVVKFGNVKSINGDSGDWVTESVRLDINQVNGENHFLWVTLTMRYENPFLSLVLPSVLITLADAVSYALPVGEGERITFRITLVLSFVMFLIILTNLLPSGGHCSALLQYHFTFCLVMLVVSTLQSMVLTRLAKCGTLLPCNFFKSDESPHKETESEPNEDKDSKSEAVFKLKALEEDENSTLEKVVKFLEKMSAEDQNKAKRSRFVDKVDAICFSVHFIILSVYTIVISSYFLASNCVINHLDFWD
ncbi:hypothetical protein DPEC_G00308280 [Dallia pectoralis]|uniref:Uncharacterized protein n=1 Tax=Dallia pectoralis TaxID=75939 RepID=A0ACC2FEN3_DALPE|nr:hypothetical protein DPEC_G00308280 [Dallia pectoralis]